MKYLIGTALALSLSAVALPAQAETIDMAEIKCAEAANWTPEQAGLIMFWLHGYYGGQAGDTKVDFDAFTEVSGQVGEVCGANPDATVMEALKSLVGE